MSDKNQIVFGYTLIKLKLQGKQHIRQHAKNAVTCHQNKKINKLFFKLFKKQIMTFSKPGFLHELCKHTYSTDRFILQYVILITLYCNERAF